MAKGTLLCLLVFSSIWLSVFCQQWRTCEPIRIEMCSKLGYNVTGMPNLVGHDLQQDAQMQLQTFTPLIQYSCSSQLRFFLCSVYVPMCTEKVPQPIGPCRPLCVNVYQRCQPVLEEFGFTWPTPLNCSKFPPENNHRHMCMEGPEPDDQEKSPANTYKVGCKSGNGKPCLDSDFLLSYTGSGIGKTEVKQARPLNHYSLCDRYRFPEFYYYVNHTESCAQTCEANILFTPDNKAFAEIWIAVWAGLCFISTLLTVLVFLVDSTQFHYPERAIIFISACYNIYSIAFFIRLLSGRSSVSCYLDSQHNTSLLIQGGLDNTKCTIVFMLMYFFGTASTIWWVILTITWFWSVGLHRGPESIERLCTYFHLAAWALPSAQTIVVLILQYVDADELTGLCYVGNQSKTNLLAFVILPTCTYLTAGASALVAGVVAMLRSRQKQTTGKNEHMEVLMNRIGIFALLYTVPATCVLAANFYEYFSRDGWLSKNTTQRPDVEIFTLKIFMSLVIGITTALWTWSGKNPIAIWRRMERRFYKNPSTATPVSPSASGIGRGSSNHVLPLMVSQPQHHIVRMPALDRPHKKPSHKGESMF